MLWNRSETSWRRSANLSAKHSAGRIPPKTSIKNPGRCQTGARVTSEIADCTIMNHAFTRTKMGSSVIESITQTHVDEHFPFFELLVALMRVHTFVTNSLYRQTTVGYWFSTFATNSFSRRTVVQMNLCPPHSVPCATRHANLPASTKPPRHRGDCAKGARQVFSQAATGRHPLQSSCNPRRAKHITNYSPTIFYDYHPQSCLKNVFFALGPTVV